MCDRNTFRQVNDSQLPDTSAANKLPMDPAISPATDLLPIFKKGWAFKLGREMGALQIRGDKWFFIKKKKRGLSKKDQT